MEDETTEEIIESDFSDNANDDSYEVELTWDSEESRPPGPSPPSSATMNRNRQLMVSAQDNYIRRLRPRRLRHRPPSAMSDTQSDDEILGSSAASTQSSRASTVRQDSETNSTVNDDDSDATDIMHIPRSPSYSPSMSVSSDTRAVRASSRSNSPTLSTLYSIHSPHSPDYSPPSSVAGWDSDVEIVEPLADVPTVENPPIEVDENPPLEVDENPPPEVPADPQVDEEPQGHPEAHTAPLSPPQPVNDVPLKPELTKPKVPDSVFNSSTLSESEEGSVCNICLDPLTNSGSHRVCCLRCGHIFGFACVERWLKVGCHNGVKRCPTCNKRACLKDIRILYLPKVVPLDTVEKDRLIQEKEELLSQKNAIEMELSRCKLLNELNAKKYEENLLKLEKELKEAEETIQLLSQGKKVVLPEIVTKKKDKVGTELLHMIEVSKDGGCRVLAFNRHRYELVVSQPSGNTIFAGYGVRVLNTVDFQPTRFVYLHQKMIRDMTFHHEDRHLLLSASLDNSAKLVDMSNGSTVHTFKTEGPLWSCCWDLTNPHLLLVGSQLGKVYQYDRRMVDTYVQLWEDKSNTTPVVALASVPSVASTLFPQGGFISCRLNSVFSYARHGDKYSSQKLPLEGPFMSMKYDYTSQMLLTSSRPSSRCPYARINFNQVDQDCQGQVCLPLIHTFNCGSSARVLSRMTTLPTLGDSLVVAHHESGRSVNMWSSKTGGLVHSFSIKDPVIDLISVDISNKCLLATLSDKRVGVYKFTA